LLFLSTHLGCDLLEQKIVQLRKEERKGKKRLLAGSEDGEDTAKKRSFLIKKLQGKNISCFHQLRLLHMLSVLKQIQGVLVSPGFPKSLKLGTFQGQTQPKCYGLVWQGFGIRGAIGVTSVRTCEKLPPCLIKPSPAGSKMDPMLPKAKPISNSGSASGITYLRRGKKKLW